MLKYKYTVVIPYYKASDTIERLLNSIPEREDIQIVLVVDNCKTIHSVDPTLLKRVSLIWNSSSSAGAGACRNIGIKHAKGEYLLFADADDEFAFDAFSTFDLFYIRNPQLVFFSPASFSSSPNVQSERHKHYVRLVDDYIDGRSDNVKYMFYAPWSKLISRDLVLENGLFFEEIEASNDLVFSLRLGLAVSSFEVSEKTVYRIFDSPGSLTKQKSLSVLDSRFFAMARYNSILKESGKEAHMLPMGHYVRQYVKFGIFLAFKRMIFVVKKGFALYFGHR